MPVLKKREWTEEEREQLAKMLPDIQQVALKSIFEPLRAWNEYLSKSLRQIIQIQSAFTIMPTFSIPVNLPSAAENEDVTYLENYKRAYHRHPNFWLEETSDGRFKYKGRFIGKISVGSKAGKFLSLLIDSDDNFVSDKEFKQEIILADSIKGIGFVKNDLRKALRNERIAVKFVRIRNVGNKIEKVSRITN